MRISSKLIVFSRDKHFIESLYKSLKPDNSATVPGLIIEDFVEEKNGVFVYTIRIEIDTARRSFKTIRSTLDEILTAIHVIYKTIFK
ncbi:MAG: KEOPS complex subunit Pcc1 [Desulfurococcaceae archaeon]|uniref:KEOPS complex subunit n=1 Tax=Staphylothermus marinus TaxID=2280 RepID=A0A7C4H8I9_STAMA